MRAFDGPAADARHAGEQAMNVPFGDLKARYETHRAAVDGAVRRVLERGWFVLGPEVEAFEREFAEATGVPHAVGVGNGTDAIEIALRGLGVKHGDEVVTVSHTATFTALGIAGAGATPVFVDVDPVTQTMNPEALEPAITERTRAIVPVHLYGMPADMRAITAIASKFALPVIEDAAQAHGATLDGRTVGGLGTVACFSFYPSKNLGAFGDGGALTTDDEALAKRFRMLRNGGQADRYTHAEAGVNSRLDELQAAVLRVFLQQLPAMNARRRAIAARYREGLGNLPNLALPVTPDDGRVSVFHLFVVRHPERDRLRVALAERGVQAVVHYPVPAHLQPAFSPPRASLPVTERLAREVLSLPIHPELSDEQVSHVIAATRDAVDAIARAT
jgi:dTDP-4-amino-4,6-dideoxygalactose transaminase